MLKEKFKPKQNNKASIYARKPVLRSNEGKYFRYG
jgi:hypothetical protein